MTSLSIVVMEKFRSNMFSSVNGCSSTRLSGRTTNIVEAVHQASHITVCDGMSGRCNLTYVHAMLRPEELQDIDVFFILLGQLMHHVVNEAATQQKACLLACPQWVEIFGYCTSTHTEILV